MMAENPPQGRSARTGGAEHVFEVRITGNISEEVLDQLADVDVTVRELRTLLRARFRDQAELHGFLAKLRTYGLEVVEVRRFAAPATDDPPPEHP